ncbi:MAG TPA: carbon-nitrogen hydrolase family protein [Candidatus Limnocylindrales bacterium]|nr:carbon-nitrogen hydrolase family protein [Candidatus Limnocylindrales bacterium]
METATLTVALISDVFFGPDGPARLRARLAEAKALGAELAVLPEIPLDPWAPATDIARDEDAEPPDGPRQQAMSAAAREVGIGLVGGAILRDPGSGARRNTAHVYDARGHLLARYAKLHLPEEPGFWETAHYVPGSEPPRVVDAFPLAVGVQICSDINRPEGSHLLGAQGAEVITAPRATELRTYERWKLVFQANALTSCAYVLSVNRPAPELGVLLGGPSVAVGPDGRILLETTDPIGVVRLDRAVIQEARLAYPGYLPVRARLYAEAWGEIARRDG